MLYWFVILSAAKDLLVSLLVPQLQFAVPESATVSGEEAALLMICSVAVWLPTTSGAYEIPITQFAPAARLVPQVLLCKLKSVGFAPASAMLLIASG